MSHKFIVYTKPACPHCDLVKNYLENRGIEIETRDISQNERWAGNVREMGYMGVPVTVKEYEGEQGHGVVRASTVGFNVPALDKMIDYIV